jgi:signal transduction histidine kinase
MSPRRKYLLTYFLICLAPLALLATLNYWNGLRSVDRTLSETLRDNVNGLIDQINNRVQQNEVELTRVSLSTPVQQLVVTQVSTNGPGAPVSQDTARDNLRLMTDSLLGTQTRFARLTLVDLNNRELFRVEKPSTVQRGVESSAPPSKERSIRLSGSNLKFAIPVLRDQSQNLSGVLIADADATELLADLAGAFEKVSDGTERSTVVVLDNSGRILYHTNHVLQGQLVNDALPEFRQILAEAQANRSGTETFRSPGGEQFLAAFGLLPRLNLSVAVARERSSLTGAAHNWGIAGMLSAVVIAVVAAFSWERYLVRKSRSIERVTEDLDAIAKGELDRRIELRSTDDARAIADNINVVTERLRMQLAREAESKQFESFIRLSAMLTHDLKNAIEALSLTVGNMEQHFDNEQFRADAMKSVAGATDKLKAIVARLTRPLTSLSGEHKRPVSVDLVPILERVTKQTAVPLAHRHKIVLNLPPSLFALVDSQRISAVVENLVLNAVEAMSEKNGTITIQGSDLLNGSVTFSISDTGVGISESFIKQRLFHPFATTKKRGVGLGLYTCREIVRANGGRIEVSSEQGAGTTFRVVLPSSQPDGKS